MGHPRSSWLVEENEQRQGQKQVLRLRRRMTGPGLGDGGVDWAGFPDGCFGDEAVEDGYGGGAGVVAALGVPLEAQDEVRVGVVGALAALDGFDDGVLRATGGDVQTVAG